MAAGTTETVPQGRAVAVKRRPSLFSYIAAWQFLAFILLVCLVWVSEVMDWPFLFFDAMPTGIDVIRACILSAAVVFSAIVAVGNTYVQQKHILRGMLILCSSCGKVRMQKGMWEGLADYLEAHTLATLKFDVCPDCLREMEREITDANVEKWTSATDADGSR